MGETEHRLPLYQRLAERIAEMIEAGTFAPGQRVPSLRKLSQQMSVSVTTVMEAYRVLEDRGLVEVRPQSGFYVRAPRALPPEPGVSTSSQDAVELKPGQLVLQILQEAVDEAFVSFGALVPHGAFLPTARLNRILARQLRLRPEAGGSYGAVRGCHDLRVQIARRALDAGCALSPEEIITTNGARHALYLSLRAVTRPGDTVILESPTYVGFFQVLQALQLRALEVATDPQDGICLEALERALGSSRIAACVLVPTFGNPLGHCMPEARRRRLLEILAAAEVPVIEDDVYGELYFDRARPRAVKAFDRQGTVLLCSSFSKTVAPGYRVGWVAPGRYLEEVERYKYVTSVTTPAPTELAIAEFLASGGYDRHLRRLRGIYRGLFARVTAAVAEYFPQGTKMTRPRGGHVAWVELPPAVDALRLYREAIRHGISFAPGPLFSASGGYRNFMRLNCAMPWSDAVDGALRTLGSLAKAFAAG